MHCTLIAAIILLAISPASSAAAEPSGQGAYQLFARSNLVAWCIVPFDAKKRSPEERAAMLLRLGLGKFAYDYRAEHIPQWDRELAALAKNGIELTAWWFPGTLNQEARNTLELFKRHAVRPQLWVMGSGGPKSPADHASHVASEARRIRSIAEPASAIGCSLALYNHGGWFGQPSNQIAIIERLRSEGITNVGIVYNLHHGHEHLAAFGELLQKMKPHLLALNLNGMFKDGERRGLKIVPVGQGELDAELVRTIERSGWKGPVGILNHTDEDAEARLQDNIDGLSWAVRSASGKTADPAPKARSWVAPKI